VCAQGWFEDAVMVFVARNSVDNSRDSHPTFMRVDDLWYLCEIYCGENFDIR